LTLVRDLQKINLDNPQENTLTFYSSGTPRFLGVDQDEQRRFTID
jgi:hypothetical protein